MAEVLEENLTDQKRFKVLLVSLKGFGSDVVSFIQKNILNGKAEPVEIERKLVLF